MYHQAQATKISKIYQSMPLRFYALQRRATKELKKALNSWVQFCKIALIIKASKRYLMIAKTWKEYCRKVWNLDDSRIRQYKSAMPYAEQIIATIPDVIVNDKQLRQLKRIISAENKLMPEVYKLAQAVSAKLGVTPSQAIFRHSLAVIEDAEITGGFVSIGGSQIPAIIPDAMVSSVCEQMNEAVNRNTSRFLETTTAIEIRAVCQQNGTYLLFSDKPIPPNFSFTIRVPNEQIQSTSMAI